VLIPFTEVSASQRQMTSYWLPHAFYTHGSGLKRKRTHMHLTEY
jgi:hypothetical protein